MGTVSLGSTPSSNIGSTPSSNIELLNRKHPSSGKDSSTVTLRVDQTAQDNLDTLRADRIRRPSRRRVICTKITKVAALFFGAVGTFVLGGQYMKDVTQLITPSSAPSPAYNHSNLLSTGAALEDLSTLSGGFAPITGPTLPTFSTTYSSTGGSDNNSTDSSESRSVSLTPSLTGITSSLTGAAASSTGIPNSSTGASPVSNGTDVDVSLMGLAARMSTVYDDPVGSILLFPSREFVNPGFYTPVTHSFQSLLSFPTEPVEMYHEVAVFDDNKCPPNMTTTLVRFPSMKFQYFQVQNLPTFYSRAWRDIRRLAGKAVVVMEFEGLRSAIRACGVFRLAALPFAW